MIFFFTFHIGKCILVLVMKMEHLKEIRQAKKMSGKRLGDMVGVSEFTIYNYEAGRREPPLDVLVAIADALDVSLDLLVRGKEKEPSPEKRERLADVTAEALSNLSPEAREIALAVLTVLQSPPK